MRPRADRRGSELSQITGDPGQGRALDIGEWTLASETPRCSSTRGIPDALDRSIGLRFRLLVLAIAAGVMAFGVAELRDAPVDVLPEFTPPYVEIQTEALGLSAEEVEQLITVPLEADLLNGVDGRRHDPLAVGARAVVDRAGLRARHRHLQGPRSSSRSG